jgi:5-methylcytosine-specific restriction endonuclease McrA
MSRKGDRRYALRQRLIDQYGGVCWICREPIDLELPTDHDEAFSVDHVVPRAHGGRGLHNNTRPAHRCCNSSRGRFHEQEANRG